MLLLQKLLLKCLLQLIPRGRLPKLEPGACARAAADAAVAALAVAPLRILSAARRVAAEIAQQCALLARRERLEAAINVVHDDRGVAECGRRETQCGELARVCARWRRRAARRRAIPGKNIR